MTLPLTPEDQKRFDEASEHPYECKCDLCKLWWANVPPEDEVHELHVEVERLKAERNRAATLASQLALDVAKHAIEIERLNRYAERLRATAERDANEVERLTAALAKSIELQSHYAGILNQYDGGTRLQFQNPEEWMKRLAALEPKP